MVSEHVVLGPDAGADGVMGDPRDYALPGNQDPYTPWPNSLLPARELGTLDLLGEGRLLDEHLEVWAQAWGPSPISHERALPVP